MLHSLPENLQLLWKLAGIVSPMEPQNDWNTYFESIGLILLTPKEDYDRDCLIPINSLTFATTGGGSVHYSLLSLDGYYSDDSPIIMTVPNCDKPNMIVGANFDEFLGLGIRTGYFILEELAYSYFNEKSFENALIPHQTNDFHKDVLARPDSQALLLKLEESYSAKYWFNVKDKLTSLDKRYINILDVDMSVL